MVETMLSFDPGGVHCGVAIWVQLPDPLKGGDAKRWKCREAWEAESPEDFIDTVRDKLAARLLDRVVGEEFKLQADKAKAQIGSSFGTVEVIGAIRHLCRWADIPFSLVRPLERDACYVRMLAVKYGFPKRTSDHVKSAICVGAVATGWRGVNHYVGDGVG